MIVPFFAVVLAALSALFATRRRHRQHLPARAVIVSPRESTVIVGDSAIRSVQSARITLGSADLARLWNPTNLERLARTYWRFLSRVTLGLIRVVYTEHARSVVLLGRPLTLLRFEAPEYVTGKDHGNVRWRVRDGLLVARAGRGCGYLALDVRRESPTSDGRATVHIEVEVANFYPAIAAGLSMPAYMATQAFVHVLVTHAFLRSLATLDLADSKVGRFAGEDPAVHQPEPTDEKRLGGQLPASAAPSTTQP